MRFEGAGWTDAGRVKETDQDSYGILIADTSLGDVALAAVADGMGGLSKGELASATAIRELGAWFEQKLPPSLEAMNSSVEGFEQFVAGQWNGLVQDLNLKIMRYGMQARMNLGTTLSAMLMCGGRYSIVHVGDTRVYEITDDEIVQLTEDQTFVKREMDAGRLRPDEALVHPQRNVLLQCIGSSKEVVPAIVHGNIKRGAIYLLCSDGFRHVLTDEELKEALRPSKLAELWDARGLNDEGGDGSSSHQAVRKALESLVKLVMDRKERDNITAVVMHVQEGGR